MHSAALALVLGTAPALPQEEKPAPPLTLEPLPFEVRTAEGDVLEAEAGKLTVPEDHRRPEGRTISLTFARLRSTSGEPGPPLVFLHGGPGGSATGDVRDPRIMSLWSRFLDLGDVILLDQRGCGRSEPPLARPLPSPPPPDVFLSRDHLEKALVEASEVVKQTLQAEGIDWTAYDTEQSADDVEALRVALGADSLRLLGHSYGTHLGLSVLRRHGAHVESAVLVGVEGPDETAKLPDVYTVHLEKIAALVAADPELREEVPDFRELLESVLFQLDESPVEVTVEQPLSGKSVVVPVGRDGLAMILVRDLGDTSDLPVLPRLLATIQAGDPSVLRWFVQKRYLSGLPVHLFTMDFASGCSEERAALIAAQARTCPLGNAMNFDFPAVNAIWQMPVLGDHFRAPLVTAVRTLFLSGSLDANTPPQQAERMRWGFLDATHLVQRNGGHEDWLWNPRVPPVLHAFFSGEDVSGADVDLPPLRFLPVSGPPGDVTHPSLEGSGTR